jgi:uncharacterized protein (DUF983 family)
MYVSLCPRCGLPVVYFGRESSRPYCRECGWNLNLVTAGFRKQDHFFVWMIVGIGLLIAIHASLHGITWRTFLLLYGTLGVISALGFFVKKKTTTRVENLLNAVASRPDADLSSAAPEIMPAKVITYVKALRSLPRPRQTQLNSLSRSVIWMFRVIPVFLGYQAVHSLVSPANRLEKFPGPGLYLLEALLAIGLWYLLPFRFKKEPRLTLLTNGEIAMGRITPVSRWQQRMKVAFEFHDTIGNLVRAQGANHTGYLLEGTYVPVFYDAQIPANCVPACALNYELVLSEGMAAIHLPSRT